MTTEITDSPAWVALRNHRADLSTIHMRDLFNNDEQRFERYHLQHSGILFDFSKNILTDETLSCLLALARQQHVEECRERLFHGDKINRTENRAVLHTALRNQTDLPVLVDGRDVMPDIREVQARIGDFVRRVHSGLFPGNGDIITDVVNIGIGGSHLGPMMVSESLKPYARDNMQVHFISNVDGINLWQCLQTLNPRTTLFVVASKTFTTQETMTNAQAAKQWIIKRLGEDQVSSHFVALSTNIEEAGKFGVPITQVFGFWDWVGGRFSVWSAVGLSVALYLGMTHFRSLLRGASEIDQHFQEAPLEENIPVIMALISIWYGDFWQAQSHVVLAYDQRLRYFSDYLQQLEMESCGKRVGMDGQPIGLTTGTVSWGGLGNDGQHAYYQLLHQGTLMIPADFLLPLQAMSGVEDRHDLVAANCLAQSRALMMGYQAEDQHKQHPGNRPSNTFLLDQLDPQTLGALIALYEHKTFVQATIWGINPFDQWGVELGKKMAKSLLSGLRSGHFANTDASTQALLKKCFLHGREAS